MGSLLSGVSTASSSVKNALQTSIALALQEPKRGLAVPPELFVSLPWRSVPLALVFLLHGQADETNLPSWQRLLWSVQEGFHRPPLSRKPQQFGSAVLP
jgi:hypothetical protein